MTNYQKELFSKLIIYLPIKYKTHDFYKNDYLITDIFDDKYLLKIVDKNNYLIYLELIKLKQFCNAIFIKRVDNQYLLLFKYPYYKSEDKPVNHRVLSICEKIYEESKFIISLNKNDFKRLNYIYKVLDNKFSYFELRIREIETSIVKNDATWIILANYYVLLDAKVILYDLQQDIFNLIDKKTEIEFGIIMKTFDFKSFFNNKIIPSLDVYFAPICMLYLRLLYEVDDLSLEEEIFNKMQKKDTFNKKYFVFMAIYICILNISFETFIDNNSITPIIATIKFLKKIIKKYYVLIK